MRKHPIYEHPKMRAPTAKTPYYTIEVRKPLELGEGKGNRLVTRSTKCTRKNAKSDGVRLVAQQPSFGHRLCGSGSSGAIVRRKRDEARQVCDQGLRKGNEELFGQGFGLFTRFHKTRHCPIRQHHVCV